MKIFISAAAISLLAAGLPVSAQDEPAIDFDRPPAQSAPAPAPAAPARAPAAATKPVANADLGLTIQQDEETPFGLVIAPWINAQAERDIDRPARLLLEEAQPIDRTVFARQIEYYDALTTHAKAKNAPLPATP